jgi:hypothetical protein
MPRKQPFPPESPTEPDLTRPKPPRSSGAAPRSKRSQAPTVPPKTKKGATTEPRTSGVVSRRSKKAGAPGAAIDEVVADLSKDPRRERD